MTPFSAIASLAASWSTTRPRVTLAIALVLALVGGWLGAFHLPLDADTNSLIAVDRPFMQRYRAFLQEFGDLEEMIVVVDPGSRGPDADARAAAAVQELANALQELVAAGALEWVHAGVRPDEQWKVAAHAMYAAELNELAAAAPALSMLGGDGAAAAIRGAAAAVTAPVPDRDAVSRAIAILDALAPPCDGSGEDRSLGRELHTQPLRSEHGRLWFVQAMPRKDFGQFNAIAEPLARVRQSLAVVQQHHPQVEIGLTGKPVLQEDELATSNTDMTRASLLSLGVITVLFIWLFRGARRPLLAVAAFGVAVAVTMGLAWLLVGRITLLSSVFLLVLVGAGLDYGVHIVSRFNEELVGTDRRAAAARTVRATGPGTLAGALATAAVFALATLTEFGGLRELGAVACAGLLTSAIVMVTVLPALLVLWGGEGAPTPRTTTLWLRCPPRGTAIVATIAVALAAAVAPAALHFDANLLSMQADGLTSVEWEHRVLADDATQTWFAASTVDDPDEAFELAGRLAALPSVAKVRSAFDLIQPPSAEGRVARERLAAAIPPVEGSVPHAGLVVTEKEAATIRDGVTRLAALARAAGDPRAIPLLDGLAARWAAVADALAEPTRQSAMTADLSARAVRCAQALHWLRDGCLASPRDALPEAVRASSISPHGVWLLASVPKGDAWDEPTLRSFVSTVRGVDPGVTGVPITQAESIDDMRRAFEWVSWMALLAVFVIAWIDFRRASTALLATMTVVAGVLLMLGLMGPLGLSINLANFFAVPMLLGLGIDSSIHVLHRWNQGPEGLPRTLTATAFTGLTTAIGFGALILSSHKGLASLGWAMFIGSLACAAISVIALPAVLRWRCTRPS